MRSFAGLALASLVALGASAAASAAPSRSPAQLARAALIGRADLGAGWSQSAAAPGSAPRLVCNQSGGSGAPREAARAASPTFAQGQQGPFAFEITAVFRSVTAAGDWWARVVHPSLRLCFAKVFADASSGGVHFHATGSQMLALRGGPPGLARYRVTGEASTSGQSSPVDFDVLLVRRGANVGELQLSSFQTPPADGLEARLARAVAHRLQTS